MSTELTFYADDGYVGKSRLLYFEVDDFDIEHCETERELMDMLYEILDEEFSNKVTPCCDFEPAIERWKELKSSERENRDTP